MVWRLPPERGGRAPQASRHSNCDELVVGASGREVMGPAALAVRLAPVADVAAGFGVEGALEAEPIRVLVEQALTIDTKPTLPASRSS